jgi:hypothetical protein
VGSNETNRWYSSSKVSEEVFRDLREVMTRKKKLYPELKQD